MTPGQFKPIYPNPYIVGNPIRSREMFFGRLDEFRHIAQALDNGQKTALIVLFGERRSGKSSILYQIQNGQLGPKFLPIFVDMQIMAGIANETEFFGRIVNDTGKNLGKAGPEITPYLLQPDDSNPAEKFRQYLRALKEHFPGRALLVLIDEYEILENKISEGCLSRHVLTFFGGLLESEQVSFVFTGSKRLESHNTELWGSELLQKATSRKISFLTQDDTARLVTQPLNGQVTFMPEALQQIYALTAGQPFYTQLICQNLVYHLNEVKKYVVTRQEVETVVDGILENPPPQLIFNWGEHSAEHKLTLALLAEFSRKPGRYLSTANIRYRIKRSKLDLVLSDAKLKTWLTDLYKDEYLLQQDYRFSFRLDLFRRWIRHDHNIWQVKKEIGQEELDHICERERIRRDNLKKNLNRLKSAALVAALLAVGILGLQFYIALQKSVIIKANGGPFMVKVDGKTLGDTRGAEDSTIFVYKENIKSFFSKKKLTKGQSYEFAATLLFSQETQRQNVEINEDNQTVPFTFRTDSLFLISNAEGLIVRLGKQETPVESWHQAIYACAGHYVLTAQHRASGESQTIAVNISATKPDTVKINFPNLMVLTLQANLPFEVQYNWADQQGRRSNGVALETAKTLRVTKRGSAKGVYQFNFINPKTGEKKALTKYHLTTDTTIAVKFDPGYRASFPKSTPVTKVSVIHYELAVASQPSGARVFVNDTLTGETPLAIARVAGQYKIRLEKEGYDAFEDKSFGLAQNDKFFAVLEPQYGRLKITARDDKARLPDAMISVDGEKLGKESDFVVAGIPLRVGYHTIVLEHRGFVAETTTVSIKKNSLEQINVLLKRKK